MCDVQPARFVRVRTAQTQKMKSLRSWEIDEKRGEKRAASSTPQKTGRMHDSTTERPADAQELPATAPPQSSVA